MPENASGQWTFDSAIQLSRSRSATITIPPRSSNPNHILPTITSTHSSPRLSGLESIQTTFPMLSDSEEHEMHLARGGGADGGGNYIYNEESGPISSHLGFHGDSGILRDESDTLRRHDTLSPTYIRDMHINHHDPMLDVDVLSPPNPIMVRYSPHDPVIGSLVSS
ncbi:hypothetical protein BS47DRAFT_1159418 [Hydnum rufescens UP504]|uniref:Uncharacterized protein n=1 Tax=Hydnum rufescens UP504 TaxID=1448309 RepID=A0A9P6ATU8_9AGAM|nr:hypothetical protein BS47DRAFT_1159418 [Hydnum rufescens UP504]